MVGHPRVWQFICRCPGSSGSAHKRVRNAQFWEMESPTDMKKTGTVKFVFISVQASTEMNTNFHRMLVAHTVLISYSMYVHPHPLETKLMQNHDVLIVNQNTQQLSKL